MSTVQVPQLTMGKAVRLRSRSGEWTGPTCGQAPGVLQTNLVIVPRSLSFDFMLFCQRNPKPCPLLEVTDVGSSEPRELAPGADLRTDLPRYRVYQHGELVDEPADIRRWWRDELVSFLLGCSFSFEEAMLRAGLPVRHVEEGRNVPMYRTNISCKPAGVFQGPTVVSMRPLTVSQTIRAVEITSRYPKAHGAPIHVGNPAAIGIRDIHHPDYRDAVTIRGDEVPVFWACGVTPQAVLVETKPELVITHSPGCMFVTDVVADALG